jgi:peroxiredoxin Q/BCP
VVFFYPKASSPGCTKQACEFRDLSEDFSDIDAQIIGISSDSCRAQRSFKKRNGLTFPLLCDKGGSLRESLGIRSSLGVIAGRETLVVDPEGIIRDRFNSQLRFKQHARKALKIIREK